MTFGVREGMHKRTLLSMCKVYLEDRSHLCGRVFRDIIN